MKSLRQWIGRRLARYLTEACGTPRHGPTNRAEALAATLRKGDVLLVEGNTRISTAIKFLTQSTWSHAPLCFRSPTELEPSECFTTPVLVEAKLNAGVQAIPLKTYLAFHTRICRPVGLGAEELDAVTAYMLDRVGNEYDLKNVLDLARYLISTPPVPEGRRRRMLALSSGDPPRAICSSVLDEAFQSIRYPILPDIFEQDSPYAARERRDVLHIRHYSLFAPHDFDISPYFQIIKPTLESGFDFRGLTWSEKGEEDSDAI